MPVAALKPVEVARQALKRIAESGLAPTPANYAREYRRAAGLPIEEPEGPVSDQPSREAAEMLRGIIEMIGQTADGLSVGIDRFGGDLQTMFGDVDRLDADGVRGLLEGLTVSGLALQKAVEASRSELETTRKRLDQVSAELEKSRAQARTDPLTGFTNRRGMEEIVEREVARAHRTGAAFSLAILDIDHFERVNDEYGHDMGDAALVHLAAVAKSGLRDTDVVCRYGGEEFVVVLPSSAAEGAMFVVDRLRVMVEKTPVMTPKGKLQIRFSAGVAELAAGETCTALLQRADKALYEAKRAGRNRVLVAAPRAAVAA
jgi:diguanylate cyclase